MEEWILNHYIENIDRIFRQYHAEETMKLGICEAYIDLLEARFKTFKEAL